MGENHMGFVANPVFLLDSVQFKARAGKKLKTDQE